MSENGGGSFWSQHLGSIIIALIGAGGAVGAAVLPIILTKDSKPEPPPAAQAPAAPNKPEMTPKQAAALAAARDLERMQGTWEIVSREMPAEAVAKKKAAAKAGGGPGGKLDVEWTFKGGDLIIRTSVDGAERLKSEAPVQIHRGRAGMKIFDYDSSGPGGRSAHWSGVYDFDGDDLKVCYRIKPNNPDAEDPGRATAFNNETSKGGGINLRLKRK